MGIESQTSKRETPREAERHPPVRASVEPALRDRVARRKRGLVVSVQFASTVRALAEKHGIKRAAKLLGCSSDALARVVGRLPVMAGTIALLEKSLASLDQAA